MKRPLQADRLVVVSKKPDERGALVAWSTEDDDIAFAMHRDVGDERLVICDNVCEMMAGEPHGRTEQRTWIISRP
jgi:hypothetical protein